MLIQVISKFSPTVHCRITFLFVLERIGKAAVTKSCKYMKAQHKRFFFFFFFYITILRGCWGQQGRVLFHPDILHLKVLPSPEPGHHLPAGRVSESICWQIFQARPGYVHVFFCSLSFGGEHRHMAIPTLWGVGNVLYVGVWPTKRTTMSAPQNISHYVSNSLVHSSRTSN